MNRQHAFISLLVITFLLAGSPFVMGETLQFDVTAMDRYAYPTGDSINFRSSPDTSGSGNIISIVSKNDLAHILGMVSNSQGDEWFLADIAGQEGFLKATVARLLEFNEVAAIFGWTPTPPPAPTPSSEVLADGEIIDRWAEVTVRGGVNIREKAASSSTRIGTLDMGERFWVYSKQTVGADVWYSILTNGKAGHVMAQYTRLYSEEESAQYQAELVTPTPKSFESEAPATVVPVTEIQLTPKVLELKVGETASLTVEGSVDGIAPQSITLSSDSPAIATVDGHGLVTAVAPGTATITAITKDGSGKSASCIITVVHPTLVPANRGKYEIYVGSFTWKQAKEFASGKGGHLATITSAEEQTVVSDLVSSFGMACWLGGYYEGSNWKWLTGEAFTYTNWNSGEPSGGEFYLGIYGDSSQTKWATDKMWNDFKNDSLTPKGLVIEYPPPVVSASGITQDTDVPTADALFVVAPEERLYPTYKWENDRIALYLANWKGETVFSMDQTVAYIQPNTSFIARRIGPNGTMLVSGDSKDKLINYKGLVIAELDYFKGGQSFSDTFHPLALMDGFTAIIGRDHKHMSWLVKIIDIDGNILYQAPEDKSVSLPLSDIGFPIPLVYSQKFAGGGIRYGIAELNQSGVFVQKTKAIYKSLTMISKTACVCTDEYDETFSLDLVTGQTFAFSEKYRHIRGTRFFVNGNISHSYGASGEIIGAEVFDSDGALWDHQGKKLGFFSGDLFKHDFYLTPLRDVTGEKIFCLEAGGKWFSGVQADNYFVLDAEGNVLSKYTDFRDSDRFVPLLPGIVAALHGDSWVLSDYQGNFLMKVPAIFDWTNHFAPIARNVYACGNSLAVLKFSAADIRVIGVTGERDVAAEAIVEKHQPVTGKYHFEIMREGDIYSLWLFDKNNHLVQGFLYDSQSRMIWEGDMLRN